MLQRIILLIALIAICGATNVYRTPVGRCSPYVKCRNNRQVCYNYRCYCKAGYNTVKRFGRYACIKRCPLRKYYNSCPTACPINCDNYYNQPTKCTKQCRPGVNCVCNKGFIERSATDFRCVRPKDCPDPCDKCGDNQNCVKGRCVCKKGYKPVGNKCVELCYNVKCDKDEKCYEETGKCVDLCYKVQCGKNAECVKGECVCKEGYKKYKGKCVELCFNVKCGKYQRCDEETGNCVGLCYKVECDEYEKCNDRNGKCVGLCFNVKCGKYQRCNDKTGKCVGLCYEVECDKYEKCNDRNGKCVGLCYGVTCGTYKRCDEKTGHCVGNCDKVKCGSNEVCRRTDGQCVCAEGYRRVKGRCVRYCKPPRVYRYGKCILVYAPPPY